MSKSIYIFCYVIVPTLSKHAKRFLAPSKLIVESALIFVVARNDYDVHLVPEIFIIFAKQAEAIALAFLPCRMTFLIIFDTTHSIGHVI